MAILCILFQGNIWSSSVSIDFSYIVVFIFHSFIPPFVRFFSFFHLILSFLAFLLYVSLSSIIDFFFFVSDFQGSTEVLADLQRREKWSNNGVDAVFNGCAPFVKNGIA